MRPFANDSGSRTSITSTAFCSINTFSSSIEMRGTLRIACAVTAPRHGGQGQSNAGDACQRFLQRAEPRFPEPLLIVGQRAAGLLDRHDFDARIFVERQRGVDGFAAAPHESQRHAIAGLVPRERLVVIRHRRQRGAVELDELIVLRDAGLVERRFPRHQALRRAARCRRPAAAPGRRTAGRRRACASPGRRAPSSRA